MRVPKRTPVLGMLLVGLVACRSLSPPDGPPAVASAPSYLPADEQAPSVSTAVRADWWTSFNSPALDALVREALDRNPSAQAVRERVQSAQEALRATRSAFYPEIGLNAMVAREKQSAAAFGLPPGSLPLPPNYDLFELGPAASYRLDAFGGIRSQAARQRALLEVAREQLQGAYLSLTGNVLLEAVQLAAASAQLQAIDSLLQFDQENLELVRRERDAGAVADTDVASAESQLAEDQTLGPPLRQQVAAARHALAVLVGSSPSEFTPQELTMESFPMPATVPVSLPSELVHRRPDILVAEAELRASAGAVGIATAQLFPSITLTAQATATALDLAHLFDTAGLVWSVAAGLAQPLFDAGMRRAERRAALADLRASADDYQQTVLGAFRQIADLLQALIHDAELLSARQHALAAASRSVRLQRVSYEKGGSGILSLLDAQRAQQRATLGSLRASAQQLTDLIQLQVAVSGPVTAPAAVQSRGR